jgi:acetyl-CoA acetyltransferase
MRQTFLAFTAASVIASAAALMPASANAMTAGTASGLQAAAADVALLDEAAYVCRHRYYSSRRICWWTPDRYRPWRHRHWRSRRWW